MPRMSDRPLTVRALASALDQFHRNVVQPDIYRIVGESERRLRDQIQTFHDATLTRFDRLETEYAAIKIALKRIEDHLAG